MKIQKQYNTLINYSIDISYLEAHNHLLTSCNTSSKWRRDADEVFILIYDIFFKASDRNTNEIQVINYHSQLELHWRFEDIENDVTEIIKIKEQANVSMRIFLERNTKSFFNLLKIPEMSFFNPKKEMNIMSYNTTVKNEIEAVNRIMRSLPFDEMTEEQKRLAKTSHTILIDKKR